MYDVSTNLHLVNDHLLLWEAAEQVFCIIYGKQALKKDLQN